MRTESIESRLAVSFEKSPRSVSMASDELPDVPLRENFLSLGVMFGPDRFGPLAQDRISGIIGSSPKLDSAL
jgi:hypothetical protein